MSKRSPQQQAIRKAARKERRRSERQAERDLDELTGEAISEAIRLAPLVADASAEGDHERVIDVAFPSIDAARFAHKRVNEALVIGEWLDAIRVWLCNVDRHADEPLSDRGRSCGYELRMTKGTMNPL